LINNQQAAGLQKLADVFADKFTRNKSVCDEHSHGESYPHGPIVDGVLFAQSTAMVAEAVTICSEYHIPVIAHGVGSSLEGHLVPVKGGISIDMTEMAQVLEINSEDFDCLVQAGVSREQLNHELRHQGLFFPIDPGANASIGGMSATRASGTNAVRYGTMKDVVIGLTVVNAQGQILHTGGRAKKSAAGYDLTRLFVGSEGTLGIITEIRLRLFAIPEQISSAVCAFPSIETAATTVVECMQMGIPLARVELLDEVQMQACINYSRLAGFTAAPTLFFEFHGSVTGVDEQVSLVEEVATANGGSQFRWAATQEERNELWTARHKAYFAGLNIRPGWQVMTTDVCVPISRLADCILEAKRRAEQADLMTAIVGHVGDGNFHVLILYPPDQQAMLERAAAYAGDLVKLAISMGGTCTGEHGVGLRKKPYLPTELGAETVATMVLIKRAMDPKNILNPGKIFDLE
jgi:D-lactate dehydrogenase (cytochrome)